jgi:hypothetical protein
LTQDSNAERFIELELTDGIKKEQIVVAFRKDKWTNNLLLSLNHTYDQKLIICPVYEGPKWVETVDALVKRLKRSEVSDTHIRLIEEVLNKNYDSVLGMTENEQDDNLNNKIENTKRAKSVAIRKYTGNGTLPLHESIVLKDGQTAFLSLDENGRPKYCSEIIRSGMILKPADNLDSQNPLPYIFESPDELENYLERARGETLESLFSRTKCIYRKYVNARDSHISILAADTIHSYFQDKFPTLHYNIFVGDNGSGKNSALLVFRLLGYRPFYVTSASAPNYFTFLGEVEECQGTIAEDESDDFGHNVEKKKILKTGYTSGGTVPKVDLNFGRTQGSYLTYCMKWLAMEELPDHREIRGILDRSFVFRFIVGDVEYNIKDVIKYAGDAKLKPLHDELMDLRKLLFAFRMVHYNDIIHDINLNVKHRSAELTKPLLRLFYSRNEAPLATEEIRLALSEFIAERNESKRNSIESRLLEVINNLIERRRSNPNSDEYKDIEPYAFFNQDIWAEVKAVINGQEIAFKTESVYTTEYGKISHKSVTSVYKSKFNAKSFKLGSGTQTRRGLIFSKEVLDRLAIHYDVPDEIIILESATDATDATLYRNGARQNDQIAHGNKSSDLGQSSINGEPQGETEAVAARLDPITEHTNHENVVCNNNNNNNSINRNDILNTEISEKEACLSPISVASVASVADIRDKSEKDDVSPSSKPVASVASVAEIADNNKTPLPVNLSSDNKKIKQNDVSQAASCVASVASVASVANFHKTNIAPTSADDKGEVIEINLPTLPCLWCDHKDPIEFDLGNHLLEHHKGELLKLPVGKGSMEVRIDYAIQQMKRMMAAQYDDEDTESNCDD